MRKRESVQVWKKRRQGGNRKKGQIDEGKKDREAKERSGGSQFAVGA